MNVRLIMGKTEIELERKANEIDNLVTSFTEVLNRVGIEYVIVSGYVAILFGRNRLSEDIDMIIRPIDFETFREFWDNLGEITCIITDNINIGYNDYLNSGIALRFAMADTIIPNVELKIAKSPTENWVLDNALTAYIDNAEIKISPIEIQIAMKLYLGSEKDIEDAKYLYILFKEYLDHGLIEKFSRDLGVSDLLRRYLQ